MREGPQVAERGTRRTMTGVVVSDKMDKTVVVAVETVRRHRLYGKPMRRTRRYKAHDERNECRVGDVVRVMETRPLSREKRWRVVEILARGRGALPASGAPEEEEA